jgi:predicted nucleotidyltransferase
MATLSELEVECLACYVSLLEQRLGSRLLEVRMFGSAARGAMWPGSSPMHSDIDLLVVTRDVVSDVEDEALANETYLLFLERGRQAIDNWRTHRPSTCGVRSECR